MDQEWKTVICRRKKDEYNPYICCMTKLENSNTGTQRINPLSLQSLIRTRIEKNINQEKADNLCAFKNNTFKNIESNCLIPTEEQKHIIQHHFNIYLKIDHL